MCGQREELRHAHVAEQLQAKLGLMAAQMELGHEAVQERMAALLMYMPGMDSNAFLRWSNEEALQVLQGVDGVPARLVRALGYIFPVQELYSLARLLLNSLSWFALSKSLLCHPAHVRQATGTAVRLHTWQPLGVTCRWLTFVTLCWPTFMT